MPRVAKRVVLDTNILLAATDEGRSEHARALASLNEWPGAGVALYASGQILREYLCVATRPADENGLGLAQADALANVQALSRRMRLLTENYKVMNRLHELLDTIECMGKQVHDANIVATMLVHGVDTLVTLNRDDFSRFGDQIAVVLP